MSSAQTDDIIIAFKLQTAIMCCVSHGTGPGCKTDVDICLRWKLLFSFHNEFDNELCESTDHMFHLQHAVGLRVR